MTPDVRTARLELRLTPDEKATIEANARHFGMKPSDYLRRVGLEGMVVRQTDGPGAGGGPPSKDDFPPAAGPSPDDERDIAELDGPPPPPVPVNPPKKKEPGPVERVFGDG